MSEPSMKPILTEIVDRLAATVASLDALEIELVGRGILTRDAIHNRYPVHKETVESHLALLRIQIAALKD